jgi:hypothetical protein
LPSSDQTLNLHRPPYRGLHGATNVANRVRSPVCLYLHVIVPECPGLRGRLAAVRSSARVADLEEDNRGVGQIPTVLGDSDRTIDEAPMASRYRHRVPLASPVDASWPLGRTRAIEPRNGAAPSARSSSNSAVPDDPIGDEAVVMNFQFRTERASSTQGGGGWLDAPWRCENRTT